MKSISMFMLFCLCLFFVKKPFYTDFSQLHPKIKKRVEEKKGLEETKREEKPSLQSFLVLFAFIVRGNERFA